MSDVAVESVPGASTVVLTMRPSVERRLLVERLRALLGRKGKALVVSGGSCRRIGFRGLGRALEHGAVTELVRVDLESDSVVWESSEEHCEGILAVLSENVDSATELLVTLGAEKPSV